MRSALTDFSEVIDMHTSQSSKDEQQFTKFLLLMCDQWRYSCHWDSQEEGSEEGKVALPNFDKLRETGLEFKKTFIASSACNASRACLFSGKYSRETGVTSTSGFGNETGTIFLGYKPDNYRCSLPKPNYVKNLGTYFKNAGFKTVYKGKWHLSKVEGAWPDGTPQGLEGYDFSGWNPPEGHGSTPLRWGFGADPSYVQDTVNAIWNLSRTNVNWFLVCSLINPHDVGFFSHWKSGIPDLGIDFPSNFEDSLENKPQCQQWGRLFWNASTFGTVPALLNEKFPRIFKERSEAWKAYFQFYAYLTQIADFQLGSILEALDDSGQRDDTLIVFLSDHGEMGGSHGMTQKWYQAYEETVHVPMIFSNPYIEPGTTHSLASLIDIAPTLLSLAGIAAPTGSDALRGVDLSPVLTNPSTEVQDAILFATDDDIIGSVLETDDESAVAKLFEALQIDLSETIDTQPCHIRTIRKKDWKLTRYTSSAKEDLSDAQYELYHLKGDGTGEVRNLAEDPKCQEKLEELKGDLKNLLYEKYYHDPLWVQDPVRRREAGL